MQLAGDTENEPAEVGRVQAVGVLGRIDQLEHRLLVDAVRQGQLHDVAGHLGSRIEVRDGGPHVRLGRRLGQVDPDGGDPYLG